MKKILFAGLIISVISIFFNVLVYTYFANKIADKEKNISFLRERNLMLSNEFNHAEHFEFFSDYYQLEIENRMLYNNANIDSKNIKNLFIKRDKAFIKAFNYAYNSTILDPEKDYDSSVISTIQKLIKEFEANIKSDKTAYFNAGKVLELQKIYFAYYRKHEDLIKSNNKEISKIKDELSMLNIRFDISKGIAVSLQVLGLILVFLKDYKS